MDIEGADFQSARLIGANLQGAKTLATDFRSAIIWKTRAPDGETLIDVAPLSVRAPDQVDLASLRDKIAMTTSPTLKRRLAEGLEPLLSDRDGSNWPSSAEGQQWATLQSQSTAAADGYRQRMTDALIRLSCRAAYAHGAVAVGLAKRSLRPAFKGDPAAINLRIRSADCPAARNIPPRFLADHGQAVDVARGQ